MWDAEEDCGGTFDECEAGRCLVVFDQYYAAGYPLSGCELPEHDDDLCWAYSYWHHDDYNMEICIDTVE